MYRLIFLVLGFVAGAVVGLVFFGGLWWTTQRLATTSRPGLLLSLSLFGRLLVLAAVLVTLASLDPLLVIGAVPGLLAVRMTLTSSRMANRLPVPAPSTSRPPGEV
jgi:F1F0 ATPase subunit 2